MPAYVRCGGRGGMGKAAAIRAPAAALAVARGAARPRVFGETGGVPKVGDGGDAALVRNHSCS